VLVDVLREVYGECAEDKTNKNAKIDSFRAPENAEYPVIGDVNE